jgi:hypothetical protein
MILKKFHLKKSLKNSEKKYLKEFGQKIREKIADEIPTIPAISMGRTSKL